MNNYVIISKNEKELMAEENNVKLYKIKNVCLDYNNSCFDFDSIIVMESKRGVTLTLVDCDEKMTIIFLNEDDNFSIIKK